MRALLAVPVLLALLLATAVPVAAHGPGDGASACKGAASTGLFPGGGVVSTTDVATPDPLDDPDIRELTITVVHGPNTSIHTVTYEDNDGSGSLTCGDTIISIS